MPQIPTEWAAALALGAAHRPPILTIRPSAATRHDDPDDGTREQHPGKHSRFDVESGAQDIEEPGHEDSGARGGEDELDGASTVHVRVSSSVIGSDVRNPSAHGGRARGQETTDSTSHERLVPSRSRSTPGSVPSGPRPQPFRAS